MSNRAKTLLLLIVDLTILFLALTTVIYFRHGNLEEHYQLFSIIFPFWILVYFIEGLYTLRTYNPANLSLSVLRATFLSIFISVILIYLFPIKGAVTPKTNLLLIAVFTLPIFYTWRKFFFSYFAKECRLREAVLIGSEETLKMVCDELMRKPHLGYKIIATNPSSIPVETKLIAIERHFSNTDMYQRIFSMLESGVEVTDLANFAEKVSGKIPLKAIDESWFIEYCGHQESQSYDFIKLLIDKTVAILMLVSLVPIAAIILPLLLVFHGRPIFFKQVRTGLNNKPFKLYKLRSMVVDAEKQGAQWAKPADARVTRIGRLLRKTRLDELPQLINILRGEMSLVGPRPERPEIIQKQLAKEISYYNLRHLVKPGVTGWAQVSFRYGYSTEDSKEKLQYDLFYVKNKSILLDFLIILKTIKTVITGAGQ